MSVNLRSSCLASVWAANSRTSFGLTTISFRDLAFARPTPILRTRPSGFQSKYLIGRIDTAHRRRPSLRRPGNDQPADDDAQTAQKHSYGRRPPECKPVDDL